MTDRKARRRAVTLSEASRLLGKHRNTLTRWLHDGCPYVQEADRDAGREWLVSLGDVLTWRERVAAERATAPLERRLQAAEAAPVDGMTEAEARRRKRAAEAALVELDLAERRGELVPASDQDAVVVNLCSAIRQRLLAVPSKIAQELLAARSAAEAHAIVERAIHEALQELADAGAKALERLRAEDDDPEPEEITG